MWLLTRLVRVLATLFALSALTFVFAELAPGDPLGELRLDARMSPQTVSAIRARYGLDGPLPVRYGRWLASVARGDWGWSFTHDQPVGRLLWPRVRNTLLLTFAAMVLSWSVALPLGIVSAARPRGWVDRTGLVVTSLMLAVPELLLALTGIVLAVRTGWFPTGGLRSITATDATLVARTVDILRHLGLPAVVLGLAAVPVLARHIRTAMRESLESPFIAAARSCGIPPRRIVTHHALPVAAGPMIALAGLSIGGLLSTSFVVEIVFGWPGMGALLLDAIFTRDLHVVVAGVVLSFGLAVLGNLVADIGMRGVDPRGASEESS
jgi:peptide/nickel transport system permease protein